MAQRVINFNPGPSALPLSALERAQNEMIDFQGSGMSIMEHSHRGKEYAAVHAETKSLLKQLLSVPDSHEILFLQGGASAQFAIIPMNLRANGKSVDYIITGAWGQKAFEEATSTGTARIAATTKQSDGTHKRVTKQDELELDPNAAYVHMTSNETIDGTQFQTFPQTGNVPLVADMSSDILWRPIDVSKFGIIYAGAQKNMGPAGVTIVIIRKDLISKGRTDIPKFFRYSTAAKEDSLHNTAPTFAIYMVRNVLEWVKEQGGALAMEKRNRLKAKTLYAAIDANPDFFRCPVEKDSRSVMNVVFRLPNETLEEKFIAEAKKNAMVGIKGHRSVGGIRISMYNAIPPADIDKLVAVMKAFAKAND